MRDTRSILIFLLATIILFGCAHSFPILPFDKEELEFKAQLEQDIKEDKDNIISRLQMARLFFMHNYIDEADTMLQEIVKKAPDNMEALAWYGANNCKKTARSHPWFMGFRKLYLVKKCLGQIKEALKREPDNFTILLISINTGAEVDKFGSLQEAKKNMDALKEKIERDDYPVDAKAHFYMAAALVEEKIGNIKEAQSFLKKILDTYPNSKLGKKAKTKLARLASYK